MLHLCKQELKRTAMLRRRLSRTHAVLGKGHSRRVGSDVGYVSTELRSVLQPLRIPSAILLMRRTSVVVRLTDGLLCGRCKWVSRLEMPRIPTGWTGQR